MFIRDLKPTDISNNHIPESTEFNYGNDSSNKEKRRFPFRYVLEYFNSHFIYLKGKWGQVLVWPVVAAVVGAGVVWSTENSLRAERRATELRAMREAVILSKAYSGQVQSTVSQFDHLLSTLKFIDEHTDKAFDFLQYLKGGIYPVKAGIIFSIVDENGLIRSSSFGKVTGRDVSKAAFFNKARTSGEDTMFIDVGQTPVLRSPVVRFVRRMNYQDGKFKGVVTISVPPAYLASFYDPDKASNAEYQAVGDPAGTVIAASSVNGKAPSSEFDGRPPPFTDTDGVRRFASADSPDKKSRIVAWNSLADYPLMTSVGMNDGVVFAEWEEHGRQMHSVVTAALTLLLLLAGMGAERSVRHARYAYRNNQRQNAYRIANEGALEGFYTLEPILGEHNEIVDFITIECNERGANLAGMSSKELLNTNLLEIYSGSRQKSYLELLLKAMQSGYEEGEMQSSSEGPFLAQWLQYRIVRLGDCLAVTLRDISESKRLQSQLWQTVHFDILTALPNRNWLLKHFPTYFEKAKAGGQQIAVLYLDIDNFKAVNSTLGHLSADHLLRAVALRLQALLRPGDHIVRIGGDEFAVLVYDVELADVEIVTQRLMDCMNEPFRLPTGVPHRLSLSAGISRYPQDGDDIETLLRNADVAMYASKASGKAKYQFFESGLMQDVVDRAACEDLLRTAVENDQFVMHFQPRVDVRTGTIVSMEALVRILHPTRGIIHPTEFISVAEDTGMILQIGEIVIQKACAQIHAWRRSGVPLAPISVNVSAGQFAYGRVKACVTDNLQKYQVGPELLELELTESCMLGDPKRVAEELASLQLMGIKLLLDDFGTGYSSLSQLQTLKLDIMKIDRSFTEQLSSGENAEIFFQAMMTMAKSLDMRVVAEGVESLEQLRILERLNCNEIQGYLVSRPVDAEEMALLLRKRILLARPFKQVPYVG